MRRDKDYIGGEEMISLKNPTETCFQPDEYPTDAGAGVCTHVVRGTDGEYSTFTANMRSEYGDNPDTATNLTNAQRARSVSAKWKVRPARIAQPAPCVLVPSPPPVSPLPRRGIRTLLASR